MTKYGILLVLIAFVAVNPFLHISFENILVIDIAMIAMKKCSEKNATVVVN